MRERAQGEAVPTVQNGPERLDASLFVAVVVLIYTAVMGWFCKNIIFNNEFRASCGYIPYIEEHADRISPPRVGREQGDEEAVMSVRVCMRKQFNFNAS